MKNWMEKGFTLLELMVVVALMGMMATIAIGSYSAITRGMNDRAALDATKSFAEAASQRAAIDRKNTYIYLFNEVVKLDTDMSAAVVCGVAVAVRPIGRITHVGDYICDEFGDLDGTFDALEETGDGASQGEKEDSAATFFRLYNIGQKGYAMVQEGVFAQEINDRDLEDADSAASHKMTVHGFKVAKGDDQNSVNFQVGDLYGQEFAVTRLPPGYVFSQSVSMTRTADLGQKYVDVIAVNPVNGLEKPITVYVRLPDGSFKSIGGTADGRGDNKP